jgi:hypothetical protein
MLVLCKLFTGLNSAHVGYYRYVTGVPLDTIKSVKAIPQLLASYTQTPVLADDVYAVVDIAQPVTTTNKAYIDNEFKDVEIIVGKGEIQGIYTYENLEGIASFMEDKTKLFIDKSRVIKIDWQTACELVKNISIERLKLV